MSEPDRNLPPSVQLTKERITGVLNRTKTAMLLALLTAMLLFIGQALGGSTGLVIAMVFAGLMNFGGYWFSDRILLRLYAAREITDAEAPGLHGMVRNLAMRAGMPMPKVYIIKEKTPNAFATGRNPQNAAVAVTEGLLEILDRRELEGVLAHELAHIRNRDTLVMTVAASIAGALSMIANMAAWAAMFGRSSDGEEGSSNPLAGLLGVLIAPIAASLVQMAISRSREFLADEAAAHATGDPYALASALRKLDTWSRREPMPAHPATAHMFIINPLTGGGMLRLFSTHPTIKARVERLEKIARGQA